MDKETAVVKYANWNNHNGSKQLRDEKRGCYSQDGVDEESFYN